MLIQGIANKNFENKIRYSFNLINLEKSEGEISKQEINALITKIKLSGFFTKVQLKSEIINKTQIITINCTPQPILTEVCFTNNKSLLVSEKILKQIFVEQIGEPKNFKSIHQAINKIYKWYYDNGFQWVQIKVTEQVKSPQTIHISIFEGQIDSVQFKLPNNIFLGLNKEEKKSLKLIRQLFNLEGGKILNSKIIERGLTNLKYKNIFDNCDYNIVPSKTEAYKWNIVISLFPSPDKSIYLIGKKTSLLSEIIESIESQFLNSLNNLLWNYMKSHNIVWPQIQPKSLKKFDNIKHLIKIIKSKNSQSVVTNIITKPKIYFFTDLYEWYNNSSSFTLNNNIRFKYNLRNFSSLNQYLIIHFQLPNINQYTKVTYCKPWLNLSNKQTGFLKIGILQQYINIKQKNITNFLNQIFNYNFIVSQLKSQIQCLKIQFDFKLNNKLNLNYAVEIQKNRYIQESLKDKNEQLISMVLGRLNLIQREKNLIVNYESNTIKTIISDFIALNTKLTYNTNTNNDIDWLGKGIHIIFLSKYYTHYQNYLEHHLTQHDSNFSQRNVLKTTFYHTTSNNTRHSFRRQFKMLDFEFGNLLGLPTFFPKSEIFELRSPILIKNHSSCSINYPKLFAKSNCEYHILLDKVHSVFTFMELVYNHNRESISSSQGISQLLFNNSLNNNNNTHISSGLGYQFKSPIKKVPPIRIGYSINLNQESQIFLRVGPILKISAIESIF
uniref:hypothetical protein n=1 Tax=Madagascaria erythrocladioides TaxID=753684 RepID=UPI001FCD6AC8|nr:hypothetical protein MW574_pgp031 [Madagascaria erythrocladioides]UNJ16636.1 hypothetical protein [Madagascaria erythrocladioides]